MGQKLGCCYRCQILEIPLVTLCLSTFLHVSFPKHSPSERVHAPIFQLLSIVILEPCCWCDKVWEANSFLWSYDWNSVSLWNCDFPKYFSRGVVSSHPQHTLPSLAGVLPVHFPEVVISIDYAFPLRWVHSTNIYLQLFTSTMFGTTLALGEWFNMEKK